MMRALLLAGLVAVALGQRRNAGPCSPRPGSTGVQRFCERPCSRGVKPPGPKDYNFCSAYTLLPTLVANEAIAKAFINYYWSVVTGTNDPAAVLTLRRAKYWNDQVRTYHNGVLRRKGSANLGRRPNWMKVFELLDLNKDKKVTKAETLAHLRSRRPAPWVILVGFSYLDDNKDSFINQDEISKIYCEVAAQTDQLTSCSSARGGFDRRAPPNRRTVRIQHLDG